MPPTAPPMAPPVPAPPVDALPPHLQRQQLRKVLLVLFRTKSEFEMLLDGTLSESLDAVAGGANLTVVCFNLINWLWQDRSRRLLLFLKGAVDERPESHDLKHLFEALGRGADEAPAHDDPLSPSEHSPLSFAAREQVVVFRTHFRQREKQFGYLKALKDLHDTLHVSHDFQGDLERCVKQGLTAAGLDVLRVIAEDVITLAVEAQEMVQGLEFPKAAAWVGKFAAAAERLLSDDTTAVTSAVKDLRDLPAQNMARLDTELVNTLQRMNPTELVETAARALELLAVEPSPPPLLMEFRTRLSGFTGIIATLDSLAHLHTTCQGVEDILAQKASAPDGLTAAAVPGWGEAATAISELTRLRPGDRRVTKIADAATAFVAAGLTDGAGRFTTLLDRFRRYFQDVDDELFETTGNLFNEAKLLGLQLRTFTNVSG